MIFKSFLSLRSLYRDAEGNLLAGTMIMASKHPLSASENHARDDHENRMPPLWRNQL